MTDPAPPPIRKKRGCLFYLCITFAVLVLLGCLAVFLTVRFIKGQIAAYTDSAPMSLPKVEMSDADYKRLDQRVKSFADAIEAGKAGGPLVLTEQDVNALLVKSANAAELADKVHVSLSGSEVKGQVSIPLNGLGWIGKGRYLNGEAAFKVSLDNGVLIVTAKEIKVKGKALPEKFMSQLRQENLAQDAYKNPKNAETIRKLDAIEVKDGRVIITPRNAKSAP